MTEYINDESDRREVRVFGRSVIAYSGPDFRKEEGKELEIFDKELNEWRMMSFEEREQRIMEISEKLRDELAESRQDLADTGIEDATKQWWLHDRKLGEYELEEYELDDSIDEEDYRWINRESDEYLFESSEEEESRDQFSEEKFDESSWKHSESNHVIYLKTKNAHNRDDLER